MASFPGQPGKPAPENKANLDYDKERNDGLRVALSKPYAKKSAFPPRKIKCQHLITQCLQDRCSSRLPANSVKALKAIFFFVSK